MEYFEDIEVGEVEEFGEYRVTEEEILEFAEQYDPQPFHTDPEAAEESPFGGLVASGWHTAAMTMRMLVDNMPEERASAGAVGVDELRWRRPVRPGETLSVRTEIAEKEPWDDQFGLVHNDTTTVDADGETMMTFTGLVLYRRRSEE